MNPYVPHRSWLLQHARHAVEYGIKNRQPPDITLNALPEIMREKRATFITLEKNGTLRGCIGRLEATKPLAVDVAENAVAAALEDPRFSPVTQDELGSLTLSISILTPPELMSITSEKDLLEKIRPGIDGIILQEGRHRSTFLPSVWEELPLARDFIRHLKQKAGWVPGYWSNQITVSRYQTYYLSELDST